jgi:membrane protease YdiL (CAAX protease family)
MKNQYKINKRKWLMALALPLWIYFGFLLSSGVVVFLLLLLRDFDVPVDRIDQTLLQTILSAVVYLMMAFIVIGLPWLIKKSKTNRHDLGLSRLPTWLDIFITPAGFIIYVFLSAILISVAIWIFPIIDIKEAQEIGFNNISQNYEYLLSFLTLVIIAPVIEEVLFRGYFFSKLKKYIPVWASIIIVSVTFGLIHGQWNLAIDTFALSIVLCVLRQITGSLWSPILLHMVKNGIAYYILFISPLIS